MASLVWLSLLIAASSCMTIFVGGEQDVGSPLRVAQCRATCLERLTMDEFFTNIHLTLMFLLSVFSNDGPNGESMCLQGPDCFMCWENCELLQSNFQVWGAMCEEKEICFPGCQEACRFHAEASTRAQQTQPVIHTKGEGVIRVSGALAVWPRPSSVSSTTPLVYVVMRKSETGPWRQIIQTLDLTTRVPMNSDQPGSMLRVLVVDPQGLVTIYSPDEAALREGRKKKKTINTEIKATTSKSTLTGDSREPWTLREISLIHQKVLVIGEIAWEPKTTRGVYLVTWEVDGGGLKGNLFTDSTCVTLSLWPDTVYHIQVELVSRTPGIDNLKSEMMDLDTGRAQKVSTESQEDFGSGSLGESVGDEGGEDVDFTSPLLSVLVSAVRGERAKRKWHGLEVVLGCVAAVVMFAALTVVLLMLYYRCRQEPSRAFNNMLLFGGSSIRSHKLVEDYTGYDAGFQPVMTVCSKATTHPEESSTPSSSPSTRTSRPDAYTTRSTSDTPDVVFSGYAMPSARTNRLQQNDAATPPSSASIDVPPQQAGSSCHQIQV